VRSVFSDEKKLSIAALSQTLPDRLIEQTTPLSAISRWNRSLVYWPDSNGRRNTMKLEVAMRVYRRASDRCIRKKLRSPGHPPGWQRENLCRFWQAIAAGRYGKGAEPFTVKAGVGRWP